MLVAYGADLTLLDDENHGTYTWVPRNTANFRFDSRVAALPALRLGVEGRWQSVVSYGTHQGGYFLANGFASWELTPKATVRLNIDNLLNKKYITGVEYGGYYGAPNINVGRAHKPVAKAALSRRRRAIWVGHYLCGWAAAIFRRPLMGRTLHPPVLAY